MPSHILVCTDTLTILGRNAVINSDWSRLPPLDPELNLQYQSTRAMVPPPIGTRFRRSPHSLYKTLSRWRVIPSTNDRRISKVSRRRPTCPRYRQAEKWRAGDSYSDRPQQKTDPASSDRRTNAGRTCHGEETNTPPETRRILSNGSTACGTTKLWILY